MLVSIREAATIQLLSLPTAVCWRNYLARSCLSTFLPLRSSIAERQSFFCRAFLLIEIIFPRGNHADRFPGSDPLQLVSGPDSVLVGDGFGHCQLQLACNLRHILTIARILSLLNTLQACRVQPIVQASRSRRDLASSKARMERRAERSAFLFL